LPPTTDFVSEPDRSSLLRPFYPALDGLRAIAILLIFSFHYCRLTWDVEVWRWGWVGVDLFFCLSGFLITGILYDSLHRDDYFRNFYIRRALRIFPLYYSFWLVLLLLTPILHVSWSHAVLSMAFYIGNFFIAGANLHHHADPSLVFFLSPFHGGKTHKLLINHFWSLCVEEQFYLVWPSVLWIVRSRRSLLRLCLILFTVLPIARLLYVHFQPQMFSQGMLYFNTFSRADGLLAGAGVALWLRGPGGSKTTLRRIALGLTIGAPLLLALSLTLEKTRSGMPMNDPVISTIGYTLVALAAAGILLLAIESSSLFTSFLQMRPLVAIGRISYGIYFYQLMLLEVVYSRDHFLFLKSHHLLVMIPVSMFLAAFVMAKLSFRFLESPFLRLKPLLAPRPGAINDPPPDSAPVLLTPESR